MKYEDCLLYCLKEIAAKDQDDLHGLRLLLNYPTPSPDEWAEVLEQAALIGDDPSPWDLLGEYDMRLRSRGIHTLLERESKRVLEEFRQVGRDINVPEHFVDDFVERALSVAANRTSSRH